MKFKSNFSNFLINDSAYKNLYINLIKIYNFCLKFFDMVNKEIQEKIVSEIFYLKKRVKVNVIQYICNIH
jgi:hypothetical protein